MYVLIVDFLSDVEGQYFLSFHQSGVGIVEDEIDLCQYFLLFEIVGDAIDGEHGFVIASGEREVVVRTSVLVLVVDDVSDEFNGWVVLVAVSLLDHDDLLEHGCFRSKFDVQVSSGGESDGIGLVSKEGNDEFLSRSCCDAEFPVVVCHLANGRTEYAYGGIGNRFGIVGILHNTRIIDLCVKSYAHSEEAAEEHCSD